MFLEFLSKKYQERTWLSLEWLQFVWVLVLVVDLPLVVVRVCLGQHLVLQEVMDLVHPEVARVLLHQPVVAGSRMMEPVLV